MQLELDRGYFRYILLEMISGLEAEVFGKRIQNEGADVSEELKQIKVLNDILNSLEDIKELKVLIK